MGDVQSESLMASSPIRWRPEELVDSAISISLSPESTAHSIPVPPTVSPSGRPCFSRASRVRPHDGGEHVRGCALPHPPSSTQPRSPFGPREDVTHVLAPAQRFPNPATSIGFGLHPAGTSVGGQTLPPVIHRRILPQPPRAPASVSPLTREDGMVSGSRSAVIRSLVQGQQ